MRIHMMYSTRCVLLFSLILPAFGATSILSIDTTQMQAKITVQTDQTGFCTYRASRGTAFSTNIPDLVDNTNTDARAGSIVNPGTHIFILGTRKANDALAAEATYWVGVTCGADSEVSRVFPTKPIQWGNTAPDILPFNSAKFGNMDHPVIDWNGTAAANTFCDPASHSYCDPNTGVEYWPVSKPGWLLGTFYPAPIVGAWAQTPIQLSGSTWTNPGQISYHSASPSVFATATATNKLFVPLAQFNCGNGQGTTGFAGGCTIDDMSFTLWCGNATTGGVTGFNMQLSFDGGQTLFGNPTTSSNCPTGTPVQQGIYPQAGTLPIFVGWGGGIPKRNMIVPPNGTVSTSGTAVTLATASPGPNNYFNLGWTAGTPILINGSYAHLAAPPTSSTTLTTVENLGTLTNVAYSGANSGVVIWTTNATSANVDVAIGMNYSFSSPPYQGSNGDTEMINRASVSVSKSADGATCGIYTVGCSSGVLSPPVTGYLGLITSVGGQSAVILWIPRNSDGTPRGETRLLSGFNKPVGSPRVNGNGDTLSGVALGLQAFFDDVDGTSVYSVDQNGTRAWRLKYTESYSGCAGYLSHSNTTTSGNYYNALAGSTLADDCFLYTVMTPLAGGKDIKTQIAGTVGNNGAYQSGLNYLGQTVGTAHTGYDLGWMPAVGASAVNGAFLVGGMSTGVQNTLGITAAFGDDGSGNGTYVLKGIWDSWSSGGHRWGGNHTCPYFNMGSYEFCSLDPLADTGITSLVFPNANKSLVSQVNRAGFGSTAVWDSNTALNATTDFYPCPTGLPSPYTSFSSTSNCVQIRVHDPFCQFTPSSHIFIDGKTEAQEFPCTTPGFGVSNASYSKLTDVQIGDYIQDYNGTRERFVILTAPSYNGLNDITFWVLRTAGFLFLQPTYGSNNLDDTSGFGHTSGCTCTHSNGWLAMMIPYGGGNGTALDISNHSNTWLYDNPARSESHPAGGPGSLPNTYSFSQAGCGPGFNLYCGTSSLSAAASVNIPFVNSATGNPSFAGVGNAGNFSLQSYQNATYNPAALPLPVFTDVRSILPGGPASPENMANSYGNTFTMTLVSGTSHTYLVSSDCCVSSPDYKRQGLQGYAGRFWMKDVSSPTTFGSAADLPNWSVCVVRNVNECVFGSTVGQYYLSAPQTDIQTKCISANFGNAVPCLSAFGVILGQTFQFRNDLVDTVGTSYRKFGFIHNHVGGQYGFTNCRFTPDGQFEMCPGYWMDGVRTDWIAMRTGQLPPVDSINRTNFVNVPVSVQPLGGAMYVRARFGYLENGGDLLHCTAYGQDCSTEIPSGSPNDPFSFTNEAVTRQACANGASCTITLPSLPNRILYYVVDRLDANGNVLQTSVMQAVAVP